MYANIRMLECMGNLPYSYRGFGYLEDLDSINNENLYQYYKDFITKSEVDIYVIGDFEEKEMTKLIKQKLNFETLKKPKCNINIYHDKILRKPKTIIETEKNNQSKLSIGCKLKDLTEFERKYVINLYNMILGGGFNSKFMQIIREEKSLCYYITSNVNKADNLLIISSGISKDNFVDVVKYIKKIMKNIGTTITEEELNNVKTEYLSILEETLDNMDSIVENMVAKDLLNLDDLQTRRNEIMNVTLDDIKNISKKVYLDTIYLLRGDLDEKE